MAVKATRVKGTAMLNQPNAKKSLGKRISTEVKRHWQLYVMLILPVTYLIIFAYLPMGGAVIAFKDYSIRGGIWGSDWVGLKHFKNFFTTPDFKVLMRNTEQGRCVVPCRIRSRMCWRRRFSPGRCIAAIPYTSV